MHAISSVEQQLRQLGITAGMTLMVHSSLRNVGAVEGGAAAIIEVLQRILGSEGTLLMSTVSGNVNRDQPVFHQLLTPSTVGVLGNVFRIQPRTIRSLHPVHSVAASGAAAKFYTEGHLEAATPWSPESPYGRLLRHNGYLLFLGTNFTVNSCFHALEIEARVPGLHTRETTTLHICDSTNRWHRIEHRWHAPKKDNYVDMEQVVAQAGGLTYGVVGNSYSRLCNATVFRDIILPLLQRQPDTVIRRMSDSDFIWE